MKKYFLVSLLFFILVSACNRKQVNPLIPERRITKLEFLELEALELSENLTPISTKNDEIMLCIYLVENNETHLRLLRSLKYDDFIFDEKNKKKEIGDTWHFTPKIPYNALLIFALVELDDTNSADKVSQLLEREILKGAFLKDKNARINLDTLIGDDDLLALEHVSCDKLFPDHTLMTNMIGNHLFDKYKYVLKTKIY